MKNNLDQFPKVSFSRLPSPIQKLNHISNLYQVNAYCLRDDLTGFAFGGNKTRKLDYLIADALKNKCDMLIAIGAAQSNFCRLACAAGNLFDLEVHLVLNGSEPKHYSGNQLLEKLLGANMHFVGDGSAKDFSIELEKQLIEKGRKPYRMTGGGSSAVGSLGYIQAMQEIVDFEKIQQLQFSKIFHATSSGGTQAGLVVGQHLLNWSGQIIGISTGRKKEEAEKLIETTVRDTFSLIGVEQKIKPESVFVDDSYVGEGYAIQTVKAETAIQLFASKESIFLDHVYTGKGAAGFLDYIETDKVSKSENILFIHTGGNVQLFAN